MSISILGIYVADLVFFADKIPVQGESVLGQEHVIGPGGKGSNQSVAVAKAGGKVNFISKIGNDSYGEMALKMYKESNIDISNIIISKDYKTGAAGILVNKQTGENAITVVPGAAGKITKEDINLTLDNKLVIVLSIFSLFSTPIQHLIYDRYSSYIRWIKEEHNKKLSPTIKTEVSFTLVYILNDLQLQFIILCIFLIFMTFI